MINFQIAGLVLSWMLQLDIMYSMQIMTDILSLPSWILDWNKTNIPGLFEWMELLAKLDKFYTNMSCLRGGIRTSHLGFICIRYLR